LALFRKVKYSASSKKDQRGHYILEWMEAKLFAMHSGKLSSEDRVVYNEKSPALAGLLHIVVN
jgi:hypothetical protein